MAAQKLQCLYENLMSNNFPKTTVLQKKLKLSPKDSTEKIEGVICVRRPRTTLFKYSIHLSVRNSREKLQTNIWKI